METPLADKPSVRELWNAYKATRKPKADPTAKARASHRKYSKTEKGRATRKVVRSRRQNREIATVDNFTEEDWQTALAYFENKCAYCGSDSMLQQEHFMPVVLGGTRTPDNMIPACRRCNTAKRDTDPLEWLLEQEHGLVTYTRVFQYLQKFC